MPVFQCSVCSKKSPAEVETVYYFRNKLYCILCFPINQLPVPLVQAKMMRLRCVAVRHWVYASRAIRRPG